MKLWYFKGTSVAVSLAFWSTADRRAIWVHHTRGVNWKPGCLLYDRLNNVSLSQSILNPPLLLLTPSVWISKIATGGKTTFSCLWATNTIFILHRFTVSLENVSLLHLLCNKAGQYVSALLYYALVIVTGSSIARCTGRKPTAPWKRPNARSFTLHCSVLILLSNHKMLFCNGIGSRRVPGDQELLKSGHWNSILWFITMNFIDLVYTKDLIRQSIWACALLGGTKCVLSLCFAPIQNEKCV